MNNLKSYTEYAVTTPTTDFVIGFDFNYGTDAVNVTVDDVPASVAGYSVIYLNSTTIRLNPAVPSGVVRLQRETDIDVPDNLFTAGAKFIASNMDENFTQIRYAQQEVRDGFSKLSDDTYEIIDTLQDVGQAAQDAADAAEQAAQTANDAAAQVNDKVSYQDLDNAIAATPHNNFTGRDTAEAHPASAILDIDGQNQQQINDATIQKVASIADLIEYKPRKDGRVVDVLSYHPDKNAGGDLFMWRSDISKSLHDGGYVIDPLIAMPSLTMFNTYYTPQNTGTGVWVRLNNKQDVHAEAYGLVKLTDDATAVWSCAAIQQAIKKASVTSTTDYHCKTVRVGKGRYYTTNPIVLTQNGTFSARLPSLIGGNGNNIFDVELIKTTQNTVGAGYTGGDKDAVIYVSAGVGTGKSAYVYGEHTSGFTLSRTTIDVGYGYFAQDSVMGYRGNIQAQDHAQNIWTDNCWMSKLGFLRAFKGLKGIALRGGTSNFGGPLYVDGAKQHGYDFYGLTYSDLECACDLVGSGLPDGGVAYDFSLSKSVSGVFAIEAHKGTEFKFNYSDEINIKGLSHSTIPVATAATKIVVAGASTVRFDYNWLSTYTNSAAMTSAEIAKYTFINDTNYGSSIDFGSSLMNENFAKSGYVAQLNTRLATHTYDGSYSNQCGVVTHILALTSSWKRLCFVGKSASIELLSANSLNPAYADRYFCNPFVLTEGTPNSIANLKPNRILKASISTNSTTPTNLYRYYEGGVLTGGYLHGYIDAQGWLNVKYSGSGNNMNYRFVLAV